jgi:hypothetical protein
MGYLRLIEKLKHALDGIKKTKRRKTLKSSTNDGDSFNSPKEGFGEWCCSFGKTVKSKDNLIK